MQTEPGLLGARAGLLEGDVIIAIARMHRPSLDDFGKALAGKSQGDHISLTVVRGRSTHALTIWLNPSATLVARRPSRLGILVEDGDDGSTKGIQVEAGMAAAKAGLLSGDVLVSVDGVPIRSGNDVLKAVAAKFPGETITIARSSADQT